FDFAIMEHRSEQNRLSDHPDAPPGRLLTFIWTRSTPRLRRPRPPAARPRRADSASQSRVALANIVSRTVFENPRRTRNNLLTVRFWPFHNQLTLPPTSPS